jgi:hypothetical protein
MEQDEYREALTDAVYELQEVENKVFTALVNIAFKGVYDDLSKLHEPGEVMNLELPMFEETGDTNLDLLVRLVKKIAHIKKQLMEDNALDVSLED